MSASFSSSVPSFSFSIRNQLEAQMVSFKHEQLIKVQLANGACTLPPSLLKHIFEGKLVNKQLEEHPAELEAAFFKELLPELPENDELEFFLVLGELATQAFKATSFDQLPQQKVKGSSTANLGNWQASSSFTKAVNFWAWTTCRAPELAAEPTSSVSASRLRALLRSTKLYSLATPSPWTFVVQIVSFAFGKSSKLPSISRLSAA